MDPDVIASVLMRGRWEGQCHRGDVTMEMGRGREGGRTEMGGVERERERGAEILCFYTAGFEGRERSHKPRWTPEAGKGKESNSPPEPKGTSPPHTLMSVPGDPGWA